MDHKGEIGDASQLIRLPTSPAKRIRNRCVFVLVGRAPERQIANPDPISKTRATSQRQLFGDRW
jgi:hypothetical protein